MQIVLVKDCLNAKIVIQETAMGGCVNYLKFTVTTLANEP